jgi:diaminopimelate decarboxylase
MRISRASRIDFIKLLPHFPKLEAVSLGGGIPHNYRDHGAQVPVEPLRELFATVPRTRLRRGPARVAARDRAGSLLRGAGLHARHPRGRREADAHQREGKGTTFRHGRCRLRRSRATRRCTAVITRSTVVGKTTTIRNVPREPIVVAGPLCESGDVFHARRR